MKKNRGSDRGFALILTLWVLAILSVLLLTFSMLVRGNIKASSYLSKDVHASLLTRGAVKRVALELFPKEELGRTAEIAAMKGELLGGWFVDPATWNAVKISDKDFSTPLEEFVVCEVTAEDAKLPLNKLTREMFSKLPNVSPVIAEAIAARGKGAPGTSQPQAQAEPPADQTAGGPPGDAFRSVEELLQVEGVEGLPYDGDPETPGLKNLLTTYTDGKIFLNGARKEVIRAIPGVDAQLAEEIGNRIKAGDHFEKVEDLRHVPGVTPPIYKILAQWLKVSPRFYRIKAKAQVNGITRTVEGVIEIGSKGVEILYMNGG